MPAANLYCTNEALNFQVEKIEKPIVAIFESLLSPRNIWQLIWLAWYAFKTILEIRKLRMPTKDMLNKHNSKELIGIRDWFLEHEAPNSPRRKVFEAIFSFMAIKYDRDNFTGRRIDEFRRAWLKSGWVEDGKFPETYWNMTDEELKQPGVVRYKALQEALKNREFDKVFDLID